jgi:hypothetical protein
LEKLRGLPAIIPKLRELRSLVGPAEQDLLDRILTAGLRRLEPDAANALARRLSELAASLNEEGKVALDEMLNLAAGDLAYRAQAPRDALSAGALDVVASYFASSAELSIVERQVIEGESLMRLQAEARAHRRYAFRNNRAWVAKPGSAAEAVLASPSVIEATKTFGSSWRSSGYASYLYYDAPGDGSTPHVDVKEFDLNMVLMVEHSGEPTSRLVAFPPASALFRSNLEVGHAAFFRASEVIHGREDVVTGERIILLACGFVCD